MTLCAYTTQYQAYSTPGNETKRVHQVTTTKVGVHPKQLEHPTTLVSDRRTPPKLCGQPGPWRAAMWAKLKGMTY